MTKRKSETKVDGIEKCSWHNSRRAKGYSLFSAAPQKSPKKWEKKLVKIRVNFARTLSKNYSVILINL